jgi:hypothetical protein
MAHVRAGLADPAPVVQTFFQPAMTASRFQLDGVVSVVDAKHIGNHIDLGAGSSVRKAIEAEKQIAFADIILLNKVCAFNGGCWLSLKPVGVQEIVGDLVAAGSELYVQ